MYTNSIVQALNYLHTNAESCKDAIEYGQLFKKYNDKRLQCDSFMLPKSVVDHQVGKTNILPEKPTGDLFTIKPPDDNNRKCLTSAILYEEVNMGVAPSIKYQSNQKLPKSTLITWILAICGMVCLAATTLLLIPLFVYPAGNRQGFTLIMMILASITIMFISCALLVRNAYKINKTDEKERF